MFHLTMYPRSGTWGRATYVANLLKPFRTLDDDYGFRSSPQNESL